MFKVFDLLGIQYYRQFDEIVINKFGLDKFEFDILGYHRPVVRKED
jgi:hypothetical protein